LIEERKVQNVQVRHEDRQPFGELELLKIEHNLLQSSKIRTKKGKIANIAKILRGTQECAIKKGLIR